MISQEKKNNRIGCLVIHGFGGSPREVEYLTSNLKNKGFFVDCPLLKGHGGSRGNLTNATYHDWITTVENSYQDIVNSCEVPIVIGFSMGGLLALRVAMEYQPVSLILLSTPVFCPDIREMFRQFFENLISRKFNKINQYTHAIFSIPIKGYMQFLKLRNTTIPFLERVNTPTLIIQGKRDVTVNWRSAPYLHSHISSTRKDLYLLNRSGHMVCYDSDKETVLARVVDFIYTIMDNGG